ncbi:MAG: anti-sigma factor [Pirellulales bacterium]
MQSDPVQEELSAYLDGELDAEAVRQVEERLARDEAYQAELRRLERAWGLLDRLPRATVNETFAKTTIEMVALAASEEAGAVLADQPRRWRRQIWLGALAAVVAGVAGFAIGGQVWTNPNESLLRDLPVIKNFELYYQAGDVELLRLLEQHGLFVDGDGDDE